MNKKILLLLPLLILLSSFAFAELDQVQVNGTTNVAWSNNGYVMGQTFTAGITGNLTGVQIQIMKVSGTSSGTGYVELWSMDGDSYDTKLVDIDSFALTSLPLDTSCTQPPGSITETCMRNMSVGYNVVNGTKYGIIYRTTSTSSSFQTGWGITTNNDYTRGTFYQDSNYPTSTIKTGWDAHFATYVTPESPSEFRHYESAFLSSQTGTTKLPLNGVNYTILTELFEDNETHPFYGDVTVQMFSNTNSIVTCDILANGTSIVSATRTNIAGTIGSMDLGTPVSNTSIGNNSLELVCSKISSSATIIGLTKGIGHVGDGNVTYFSDTFTNTSITLNNESLNMDNITAPYNGTAIIEWENNIINNDVSAQNVITQLVTSKGSCGIFNRTIDSGYIASTGGGCSFQVTEGENFTAGLYVTGTNITITHTPRLKFLTTPSNYTEIKKKSVGTTPQLLESFIINNTENLDKIYLKAGIGVSDSGQNFNMYFSVNGTTTDIVPKSASAGSEVLISHDLVDAPKGVLNISLYGYSSSGIVQIQGGDFLGYLTEEYSTNGSFLSMTAKNLWNDSSITNFSVEYDGLEVSTDDGVLELFTFEPLLNLTFKSDNYLNRTYLNHDTSISLEGELFQSYTYINPKTKFNNLSILNASLTAEGHIINTTNGTLNLNPNLGLLTYVLNSTGYFGITDTINISALTNLTTNLYDSITEINLINASDSSSIDEFNVTLSYDSIEEFYNTTNGSAYFNLTQNLTYNITIDASGFYSNSFQITPTSTNYQETFQLIKIGNLEIEIFDSDDGAQITQNVNFTLTDPLTQQKFNFTGGNFTLTGLVEGTEYSLVFNSEDYAEASFLITYSESLAKDIFKVYMSKTAIDVTFNVLETSGDIIQNANVQVSGYVNGSIQVVAEKLTDGVGQVRFNLNPDEPYFFVFSKDDYITNNVNIVTFNTEYTITMQKVNVVEFDGPASNVLYTYDPKNESLNASTQTFTWTIVPQEDAVIDEFGIELYFNGSLIANNSLFTETGGAINLTYDMTPYINETVSVQYYFIKENFTRYELNVNYDIINISDTEGSLIELRNWVKENVSERDKIITWVLITAFISMLVYLFSDRDKDITLIGALIAGSINVWLLAFSVVTTMIFVTLLIITFLAELKALDQRGAI